MQVMPAAQRSDADLVTESLDGSRDAFRQIVERYQNLICSIAYSATGNVSRSEDIAQETFITAWTQLRSLREPQKLGGWLCGIARNRLHRDRREDLREPSRGALPVEHADETPAADAMPSDEAVSREEQAILWRSLEKIPEIYREPLILFYREHQSIEQVATALELSSDVVKQRLSRGRKYLQDEVQAFVEKTLRRTAPGQTFSIALLGLLPAAAGPAVATSSAGLGAKGAAAAKTGLLGGLFVVVAPFLGIAAGIVGHWAVIRDTTQEPAQRRKKIAQVIALWVLYLGCAVVGESSVYALSDHFAWDARLRFVAVAVFWWAFIVATVTVLMLVIQRIAGRSAQRQVWPKGTPVVSRPIRSGTLMTATIGSHLAMFSWLIAFAWRQNDLMGVGITSAATVGLTAWGYLCGRGRSGAELMRLASRQVGLIAGALLLILNLRTDVWVSAYYGVSAADAGKMLPTWLVPVLTIALVLWVAMVVAVTRRNKSAISGTR